MLPQVMNRPSHDGGRRASGAAALFWAQLWSDRALVSPARHCVYNAFVGLLALALAVIVLVEPSRGTALHAIVFGAIGLTLLLGPALVRWRPVTLTDLLALDGILLVCLGVFFAGDSAVWALRAPAEAPFRYAPGVIVILFLYGALQLARPGDESPAMILRRRKLRRVALITGIVFEIFVAATLLVRASHS